MAIWNRREFVRVSSGVAALGLGLGRTQAVHASTTDEAVGTGAPLMPWSAGLLDIHHIATGRGNATLVIAPDGTSLLIDAGASSTQGPAMDMARPDGSRRPGEWIARYVERRLQDTKRSRLDYALLTHLHGDHVGDVVASSPRSSDGDYRLTGISDVAETIKIGTLIDRGYPDYNYPAKIIDATSLNYAAFARAAAQRGTKVERAQAGSSSQIAANYARDRYPEFAVRVIAGNGAVWTGDGETSKSHFPDEAGLHGDQVPSENSCSIALRLSYGRFSYFTGGDLNCDTNYGRDPWRDVEGAAAKVAGPVSVAVCDHHGYFDANGAEFVGMLKPRVWIIPSWHASHPALSVLANLYSPLLYTGPRDVFCLALHPAAALACGRFSDRFQSSQGHVVVRVEQSGDRYSVLVLDDGDERGRVKAVFGPYVC